MKTKLCSYAVITKNGKYILVKSKDSKKWNLPGGAVKKNESVLEGAVRETKEETNLNIELEYLLLIDKYYTDNKRLKYKHFFRASSANEEFKNKKEIDKIKKFSYEKIESMQEKGKLKQGVYNAITKDHKEEFYELGLFDL